MTPNKITFRSMSS